MTQPDLFPGTFSIPPAGPVLAFPDWIAVRVVRPPLSDHRDKLYLLAVDAKGRMSIGYAYAHSTADFGFMWTFAKPIGNPTHWMHLPTPPKP